MYYFNYTLSGEVIEQYVILNEDITVSSLSGIVTVIDNTGASVVFDVSDPTAIDSFRTTYFSELSALEIMQNLSNVRNVINGTSANSLDTYLGEDAHLVTYNLRANVIESIDDCNIPCERFSMDTWVALMQKKMAAKNMFCRNNLTEAARIMHTVEERCKNCS